MDMWESKERQLIKVYTQHLAFCKLKESLLSLISENIKIQEKFTLTYGSKGYEAKDTESFSVKEICNKE